MFTQPGAELFVPDGSSADEALSRTTHLGVGAHADDLEIMAIHGILAGYRGQGRCFAGAVVTDGAGSPGAGADRAALRETRRSEQKRAATLGRYGAVALLDHPSASVKDPAEHAVVADLVALLRAARPEVVYTHALSDAHDTHVAVTLRLLAACRALGAGERPARILGCEVWRDLDWLPPEDKVLLAVDDHEDLQAGLVAVFESQIGGGKRYDRAVLGRRQAHAVFSESHAVDRHRGVTWAMDLTPLASAGDPAEYLRGLVGRFEGEVLGRLDRVRGGNGF
ncbi:MAG TPA: PIG-L family deacetylase [Polyangiaceae bacterium]